MDFNILDSIDTTAAVAILASLPYPTFFFFKWLRNRQARKRLESVPQEQEPLIGTLEDLHRAEAEVSHSLAANERKALLDSHVLIDKFSTLHGFSNDYMDQLTRELETHGLAARVIFQETLPLGYGSMTSPQGVYELYVRNEDADRAVELLEQKLKREPHVN